MKITCNTIKDLLPLYCDSVCSDDSKALIESHLNECEICKKVAEAMKSDFSVDKKINESEEKIINSAKKTFKKSKRKYLLTGISVTLTVSVLVFLIYPLSLLYANTAPANDEEALAKLVGESYVVKNFNITETKKQDDWLFTLLTRYGSDFTIAVFKEDKIFKNRQKLEGITGVNSGYDESEKIASLIFWQEGENVIAFGALALPEDAKEYLFEVDGKTYSYPIENGKLSVFVVSKTKSMITPTGQRIVFEDGHKEYV